MCAPDCQGRTPNIHGADGSRAHTERGGPRSCLAADGSAGQQQERSAPLRTVCRTSGHRSKIQRTCSCQFVTSSGGVTMGKCSRVNKRRGSDKRLRQQARLSRPYPPSPLFFFPSSSFAGYTRACSSFVANTPMAAVVLEADLSLRGATESEEKATPGTASRRVAVMPAFFSRQYRHTRR